MSVVSTIFDGLAGKSEVAMNSLIPSTGFRTKIESNRDPFDYGPYTKAPILFNGSIDYSSRRGVLQCNGLGETVLRRPAIPSSHGMIPPTGIGRHQMRGLAYDPAKPIDTPLMPLPSSVAAGQNSHLGQPR